MKKKEKHACQNVAAMKTSRSVNNKMSYQIPPSPHPAPGTRHRHPAPGIQHPAPGTPYCLFKFINSINNCRGRYMASSGNWLNVEELQLLYFVMPCRKNSTVQRFFAATVKKPVHLSTFPCKHLMKFTETYQDSLVIISLAVNIYFSIFVIVSLSKFLCHPVTPCFWRNVKKIIAALPETRNDINYLNNSSVCSVQTGVLPK